MLTEPWIVELVSMALRTNTPPQPVERRNNRTGRRSEKRRFTNHLASEVYRQCRSCGGAPDPRKTTTDVAKLRSWRKSSCHSLVGIGSLVSVSPAGSDMP